MQGVKQYLGEFAVFFGIAALVFAILGIVGYVPWQIYQWVK